METLVLLLICSGELPREKCTPKTARAVISTRIEGMCGVGVIAATAGVNGVSEDEYPRIRCKTK